MIPENSIICGAMPEATKVFPDGYFNCSISSPPYWALRDYGLTPSIWDGDENCEHKWDKEIVIAPPGGVPKCDTNVGNWKQQQVDGEFALKGKSRKSQFCSKCGAWRRAKC